MRFLSSVQRVLDTKLFSLGEVPITVSTIATVILVMVATVVVSKIVRRLIARAVGIWMDDPWEWRPAIHAMHEAIWWAFQKHGIVIAFPQLDLHLDKPVVESLERLATRGAS